MIFETYSARLKKAQRGDEPDVYRYGSAPKFLCQQIVAALREGIGPYAPHREKSYITNAIWNEIARICDKEVEMLVDYATRSRVDVRICDRLTSLDSILPFLDMLEISCRVLMRVRDENYHNREALMSVKSTFKEINSRFKQHSVGYQIHDGTIIRIDSEYAHQEIIKPALLIFREALYQKASEDFLTAHNHYRADKYKDAVTAANRTFESTLKAICDAERWTYQSGDTAAQLVTLVSQNGLFTHAFDKSFNSFIAIMKTGLPSIRNDAGAHGESLEANAVTAEIARYAINMTATNILFLAECHDRFQKATRR
jgi:hypothetical protein